MAGIARGAATGIRRVGRACVVAGLAVAAAVACRGDREAAPPVPASGPWADYFKLTRRIVLEERGDSVISGIGFFVERPGGGYLVGDAHIPWVRVHDDEGALVGFLGGFGDGPGQLRAVAGVLETPDGIYVSDNHRGRITRFTSHLAFDTVFTVSGYPGQMHRMGERLVVEIGGLASGNNFHLAGRDLDIQGSFMKVDSLVMTTPYWRSFSAVEAAVLGDQVLTADEFLYPLHVFDARGEKIGDFGTPPPTWRRAPPLKLGALMMGPDMAGRAQGWLSSFTVIDRVDVYRNATVLVTHARNTPSASDLFGREHYAVDVYDRRGRKLLEDVAVPGTILGAGRFVYAVLAGPPDPWTVGVYELKSR
jgi:hypothetical protein